MQGGGALPATLLGDLAALLCAATWAATSLLVRSQAGRLSALAINVVNSAAASCVILVALALVGPAGLGDGVPLGAVGLLVVSAAIGPVVGNTLFFESMRLIGVARAMPLASTNPLFAVGFAVVLLGEVVMPRAALGTLLVVVGIGLVAARMGGGPLRDARLGVALALGAAVLWGLGTVAVAPAMRQVEPLLASAIRLPATTAILGLYGLASGQLRPGRPPRVRSIVVLAAAGLVAAGSSLFFLLAVQDIGAARTAALVSVAPLFTAPFALWLYRERLTARLLVGTGVSIAGIALVVGG